MSKTGHTVSTRRLGDRRRRIAFCLGVGLTLACTQTTARGAAARGPEAPDSRPDESSARSFRIALQSEEEATIALFAEASASVVCIQTLALHEQPSALEPRELPRAAGSGFVWDAQGHIVTNYHVVEGGYSIEVSLADHTRWRALLVGVAADKDLAVLRIETSKRNLRPLPVGDSGRLRVGQKVFAVGNPFGFDHTLTTGIVSALRREIDSPAGVSIGDVIQTDAAINPGNSGGPLLDISGHLVGVNTAIYSPSGTHAGLGFAIPAGLVARVVPELILHGRILRPGLGLELAPDSLVRSLGLRGALVLAVEPGSEAERRGIEGLRRSLEAGWTPGDLIEGVDGRSISSAGELLTLLESKKPGEVLEVELFRDGHRRSVEITLSPPAPEAPLKPNEGSP